MASKLKLNTNAGGSISLQAEDTLTTDEQIIMPSDGVYGKSEMDSYMSSSKNKLINGGFDIWQRGTSFTATGYSADRWYYNESGGVGTVTKSLFGHTDTRGSALVLTVTTSSDWIGVWQYIENAKHLQGKQVTVSGWINTDVSKLFCRLVFRELDGAGVGTQYYIPLPNTGGGWIYWSSTITLDSPDFASGNYMLQCIFEQDSNTDTSAFLLGLAEIQLEEGSVATPFEQKPIGTELSLCERYYEILRINNTGLAIVDYDSSIRRHYIGFKTEKRITPAISTPTLNLGTVTVTPSTGGVGYNSTYNSNSTIIFSSDSTADAEL